MLAGRIFQRGPRWRAATSSPPANSRILFFFVLGLILAGGADGVGRHLATGASNGRPVRTVMDLMEVLLNRDIMDMLANGGFDFRQPARIFLPPKFYSTVPLDRGHMSPEEILSSLQPKQPSPAATGESVVSGVRASPSVSSPSSYTSSPTERVSSSSPGSIGGGKADHQRATAGKDEPTRGFGFGGNEQVLVLDGPDGSRVNLISYSDGKVTSTAMTEGGRETAGKIVGPQPKAATPAQHHGRPLTSSITDQTVSPNVARALPVEPSLRFGSTRGRSTGGGSGASSTDRLRAALPGEPDVDYPILGSVPATTFSCDKRHHGYYADVEARCQVFRVCANTDSSGRGFAFLCPNGTLFNQQHLVCDWYTNVRCADSESFYHVNEDIGRMAEADGRPMVSPDRREMMDVVMSMVTFPMRTLMEQMDGVGLVEVRLGGQGAGARPVAPEVPAAIDSRGAGQPASPSTVLTPIGIELEPPALAEVTDRFTSNNVAPVGLPSPGPASPNRAYTPQVDGVYVSSLGTLSTDADSGFDPARSTLLTPAGPSSSFGASQRGTFAAAPTVPASFRPTNRVSGENPSVFSRSGPASDVQLIKANLVKVWNGPDKSSAQQSAPLKLVPVPQTLPQVPVFPRPEPPRFVDQFPVQPAASGQQQELLPPTGVLPPSSFTHLPASQHRFAPVRNQVLSVQKVTVQPQYSPEPAGEAYAAHGAPSPAAYSDQQAHGGHDTSGNQYLYSHPIPNADTSGQAQASYVEQPVVYTTQQQFYQPTTYYQQPYVYPSYYYGTYSQPQPSYTSWSWSNGHYSPPASHRRYDVVPQRTHAAGSLFKRKKDLLVQVVPSLSYYLNNAQEKRAYDEAVHRGLLTG